MDEKKMCGARNGTYSCMRNEGHSGNKKKHVAITISAGRPLRFLWGDGKEFFLKLEV